MQFRNPYEWLEAMRHVPHHAPAHINLNWENFLSREWSTDRVGLDLNVTQRENAPSSCQEDFAYNQIVSCVTEPLPKSFYKHKLRFSENQPFYELKQDGSGEAFENITAMRAAKIRNFLQVQDYEGVVDAWTIQYEYLVSRGTNDLLTKIEEWTGKARDCKAAPPQFRKKRPVSRKFAEFINDHVDWDAEGMIGYTREEFERRDNV